MKKIIKEKYFPKKFFRDFIISALIVLLIVGISKSINYYQEYKNPCKACIQCYNETETNMICIAMPSPESCTFDKPPVAQCSNVTKEQCINLMKSQPSCKETTNCKYNITVSKLKPC